MARRKDYLPVILRANLNALNADGTEAKFAEVTRLGMGSAHRLLKKGQNIKLDTLQQIAEGYRLEAWELLVPNINPQLTPKKRLAALELELDILRQQLNDVRLAIQNASAGNPSPRPLDDDRAPDAGRPRNHPPPGEAQGHEPKG